MIIIWEGSRGLILLVGYVYLPIKIFDIQMTLPEMTTVELSFFFTVGNFAILEIFLFGIKCDKMTLIFASGYVNIASYVHSYIIRNFFAQLHK